MRRPALLAIACAAALLGATPAYAQRRTVNISVPSGASFLVTDVTRATPASPGPLRITFSTQNFKRNDRFHVSVSADTPTFAGPGTARIPASAVSWTATTSSGTASDGTMQSSSVSPVYTSVADPASGSVDVSFLLAPLAIPGLRAGTHTLTVRWRLEVL